MFAKRVFQIGGIIGLLLVIPGFFNEPWIAKNDPPALNHPEYFYGFYGIALAWQIVFLVIARDPVRFRPIMPMAMIEKFSFAIAAAALYLLGRTSTMIFGFGMFDLFLGTLFVVAYLRTPNTAA